MRSLRKKKLAQLKRMEPLPASESLERAFSEIERPVPPYTESDPQINRKPGD